MIFLKNFFALFKKANLGVTFKLSELAANYSLFNDLLAPLSIERVPGTPGNFQVREVFRRFDFPYKFAQSYSKIIRILANF